MKRVIIHILGTIILLGVGAALFVTGINGEGIIKKMMDIFFGSRGLMIGVFLLCIVLYIDALKRKMPYAFLWLLGMFVLPIIAIPLYLIIRPPIPESAIGEKVSQLCPHCGNKL